MKKCLLILILMLSLSAFPQTRTGTGPDDGYEDSAQVAGLLDALNRNVKSCNVGVDRFNTILDLTKALSNLRVLDYLESLKNNDFLVGCSSSKNVPSKIQCLFDEKSQKALHALLHQPQAKDEHRARMYQELKKHAIVHNLNLITVEESVETVLREIDKALRTAP